jgi:hypothetical protein
MYPETNQEKAALYFKSIEEISARLRCIEELLEGKLAPLIKFEFCQLQMRLSCECLAIACLAAQGDFKTHKSFREKYQPGEIFKALGGLYPGFFPTPSKMHRVKDGHWHFDDVGRGNTISREEVEKAWNLSGSHLHRGSAKRYISEDQNVDLISVARLKDKFLNLVMDHIIILADQESRLHVHVDRVSQKINCHFLFIDKEQGTARVEHYETT